MAANDLSIREAAGGAEMVKYLKDSGRVAQLAEQLTLNQ
jgi:hypothetical protein